MPVTIGGSGPITGVTSINTSVSDTELGYLDGVSSALQTQINAKAAAATSGLRNIIPSSIAYTNGTASISGNSVEASGVSAIRLNGVFAASPLNYRIVIAITGASGTDDLIMRFSTGGSDISTSSYDHVRNGIAYSSPTTVSANGGASATSFTLGQWGNSTGLFVMDVITPNQAGQKSIAGLRTSIGSSGLFGGRYTGASAADGFFLTGSGQTISMSIRVYGYND